MTANTQRITPRLTLDFLSASLDPIISFTRSAATATVTDSSGFIAVVAADTPRFNYNPLTLACNGLLVEEARTNVLTYSKDFSTNWVQNNLARTLNQSIAPSKAPDGATTVTALVENVGLLNMRLSHNVASLSAATYAFSIYAKSNGRGIQFYFDNLDVANNPRANFDLVNGVLGSVNSELAASITAVGGGWYQCTVILNSAVTSAFGINVKLIASPTEGRAATYTGDGVSGAYIYGAQFELGASPTTYIPTEATAVTRNADDALITGANFSNFWQSGRGGVLVRALPSIVSGTRPLVQFDDNTADNIIALRGNTTNQELYIVDGGTPQAQIDAGTIAANTAYDLTGWWQTNFCAARKDNGARVEDLTATIPTVTQARLGSDGTNYLNGHLATINYYARFSGQIYSRRKNKAVFNVI